MAAAAGIAGTRIAADAVGVRAQDEVINLVNRDATVRVLEVIQEAAKHMRACRRARLLPEDINYALAARGQDPVHIVVDPEENIRFRRADAGTRTVFYIPSDNDVDVADLLHLPLPPAPVPPTLRSSWLALDGRAVPQDDLDVNLTGTVEGTAAAAAAVSPTAASPSPDSTAAASPAPAQAVSAPSVAAGPAVSPAATLASLSPHTFCLFRALTRAFARPGREASRAALLAVSVGALRPLLIAFVETAAELTAAAATVEKEAAAAGRSEVLVLLYTAVSIACAIISAPFNHASLQPYAHLLIGPLLVAATGPPRAYASTSAKSAAAFASVRSTSPSTGDVDACVLRSVAAAALGLVAVRYGEVLVALPQRLASSLTATLLSPASPADAVVGAALSLAAVGVACVSAVLLTPVGGGASNLAVATAVHGSRDAVEAAAPTCGYHAAATAAASVRTALSTAAAVALRSAAMELRTALVTLTEHGSDASDAARCAAAAEAVGRTLSDTVGQTLGHAWSAATSALGCEALVHSTGLLDELPQLSAKGGLFRDSTVTATVPCVDGDDADAGWAAAAGYFESAAEVYVTSRRSF